MGAEPTPPAAKPSFDSSPVRHPLLFARGALRWGGGRAELQVRAGLALSRHPQGLTHSRKSTAEDQGGRNAFLGLLHKEGVNQVSQPRREAGPEVVQVGGLLLNVSQRRGHIRGPLEGRPAGQHFEQNDPERVEVGPGVRFMALDLLRGQVLGVPSTVPVGQSGRLRRQRPQRRLWLCQSR